MQPQRARFGNGIPRLGRCHRLRTVRPHGLIVRRSNVLARRAKMLNITACEAGTEHALQQSV